MNNGEFIRIIAQRSHQFALEARDHLHLNNHMHDLEPDQISSITDDQVRAILNGFVNYIGVKQCGMDYAMNTSDFPRFPRV